MCAYHEFWVTRGTAAIGWDVREASNAGNIPSDEKTKKCVLRIISRFEYADYKLPGYFLMYDEMLGKFYCAQASEGQVVDDRTNMSIAIRVPVVGFGDGFMECVQLIKSWEGVPCENLSARMICDRYGIKQNALEIITCALYEKTFSQVASPMEIVNSKMEWNANPSEFVTDMMKLCYLLLPSSKLFRLSLGWRIPAERLSGVRILFSQKKELKSSFDMADMPILELHNKDGRMIKRIVQETLDGNKSQSFQDKVDQYYIKMANYESMCWNYWYYTMDERKFECSMAEFKAIRADIRSHILNGFKKAETLYECMIENLISQRLSMEDKRFLLLDYIEVCIRKKECSVNDVAMLWSLIHQYMGNDEALIYKLLSEIHAKSNALFYELVKEGISYDYLKVQYLEMIEPLKNEDDVRDWLTNHFNQELSKVPKVKDWLMDVLEPLFDEEASIKQIQKLMSTAYAIDKVRCAKIVDEYLIKGVRDASKDESMITLSKYLEKTESLWWDVKIYRAKMEEAYENMACSCKTPLTVDEIRAFIEIKWDFSNKQRVQMILLEHCRRYLEMLSCGDEDMEACLELLLRWDTGISNTKLEIVQCRELLGNLRKVHMKEKFEAFAKDIERETKVEARMKVLDKADEELDESALKSLAELFWNKTTLNQFAKIRRYSNEIWKNRYMPTPLNGKISDNILPKLYDVYQRIYSSSSIEEVKHDLEAYLDSADRKMAEAFLNMLLLEWVDAEGEYFERILEVLSACWEDEKELFDKINALVEDKKTAKKLIRKITIHGFMGISDRNFIVKFVGMGSVIFALQMGVYLIAGDNLILAGILFGVTATLETLYWTMKKEGKE